MILFKSCSWFRESLSSLLKVKRGVYAGVKSEIKEAFLGKTMQEILSNRDMVLLKTDAVVVKLRMKDSKNKLSKANGFRLIYLAYKDIEEVVFMEVYPKRGPLQKIDLSDKEFEELLALVEAEAKANSMVPYDF
ncbi:MAG: hypothetical protein LIP03_11230 [Bacteroidales bacterium]|nr:hypothetical protein [Bacteroidales bacterium]